MTAFDDALALVLLEEGGKVDLKSDPGGRTDHGVTQRTFDAWQDAQGLPKRDVWTISAPEVAAIYRNRYGDPIRFDALPPGVAYAVFDDAVNSGVHEAACELQRALGMTGAAVDGVVGLLTAAAAAKADRAALIGKLCDGRLTFLRRLKAFVTFGRGWTNRVAFVRGKALAMAKAPMQLPGGTLAGAGTGGPVEGKSPATGPVATTVPSAMPTSATGLVPPCTRPGCPLAAKAA